MNRILLLSVLLITMGCASSNFTSTSDLKYPEYKGAVRVFFNEPKEIDKDRAKSLSVLPVDPSEKFNNTDTIDL